VAIGALSSIPLAFEVLGGGRLSAREAWPDETESGPWSDAHDRLARWDAPVPS
jgi:hypothetical protein